MGSLFVLLLLWGAYKIWFAKPASAPLITATVERGDIENSVLATGAIQASQLINVGSQVSGQVKKLHVQVGDAVYPVLRIWESGFALDGGLAPGKLRGLVDLHDGPRHVLQCLIVASTAENGELICDFKRATAVSDQAPVDFWRGENAPAGYLPRG